MSAQNSVKFVPSIQRCIFMKMFASCSWSTALWFFPVRLLFFAPLVVIVIVKKTAKSLRLARALNCASHHPYCRSLAKTTKWSRFIYFLRIFCKANLLFFEKWLDKSFPFLQKLTIWQSVQKTCRKVVKWCLLVPLLEISSLWLDAK